MKHARINLNTGEVSTPGERTSGSKEIERQLGLIVKAMESAKTPDAAIVALAPLISIVAVLQGEIEGLTEVVADHEVNIRSLDKTLRDHLMEVV